MATNSILTFCGSGVVGTDVLSDASYSADSQRPIGHQPGTARAQLANKVLKQSSLVSAAIAQFIADNQANNINDALAVATLEGYFADALAASFSATAGRVLQQQSVLWGDYNTYASAAAIPYDNTIPQNTEGAEAKTLAITPLSDNSIILIDVVSHVGIPSSGGGLYGISALFVDSTADALAAQPLFIGTGGGIVPHKFYASYTNSSTTTKTFKLRVGTSTTGNVYINGDASGGKFGGAMISSIVLSEVKV